MLLPFAPIIYTMSSCYWSHSEACVGSLGRKEGQYSTMECSAIIQLVRCVEPTI